MEVFICEKCKKINRITTFGVVGDMSYTYMPFCLDCAPNAEDWPREDVRLYTKLIEASRMLYQEKYPIKIKRDAEKRRADITAAQVTITGGGLFGTGAPAFRKNNPPFAF